MFRQRAYNTKEDYSSNFLLRDFSNNTQVMPNYQQLQYQKQMEDNKHKERADALQKEVKEVRQQLRDMTTKYQNARNERDQFKK